MNDHQAFLDAIIANPQDDVVRLVYADWLEENGEPERAEFIRLQITIHRLDLELNQFVPVGDSQNRQYLQRIQEISTHQSRENQLLQETEFLQLLGIQEDDLPVRLDRFGEIEGFSPLPESQIQRGFVSTLRCELAEFLGDLDKVGAWKLISKQPITELHITDKHPVQYNSYKVSYIYFKLVPRADYYNFPYDSLPWFLSEFLSGHISKSPASEMTEMVKYETDELARADLNRAVLLGVEDFVLRGSNLFPVEFTLITLSTRNKRIYHTSGTLS